jgi:hypothetical protein
MAWSLVLMPSSLLIEDRDRVADRVHGIRVACGDDAVMVASPVAVLAAEVHAVGREEVAGGDVPAVGEFGNNVPVPYASLDQGDH